MLNVLAASSPMVGADPAVRAGEVDLDAVTGEWEVQWLLPFLWMGFVPEPWFAAHADRLLAALAAGEDESPALTDVVVPWSTAAEVFRTRLPAVVAVWPEFAEPANRFLSDVTSVAERTTNPVIRLQLDELVTASWGDETELSRYVADVLAGCLPLLLRWSRPSEAQASRCPPWPTTGCTANVARVRPPTTPCAGSWQRLASEVRDAAAAAASFPGSWSSSTASSGRGCCTTSGRTRRRGADPRDVGAALRAPVARTPRDRHDGTRTLGDTHRGPCGRRGRHVPAAPEPGQLSGAERGGERQRERRKACRSAPARPHRQRPTESDPTDQPIDPGISALLRRRIIGSV